MHLSRITIPENAFMNDRGGLISVKNMKHIELIQYAVFQKGTC